jgi:glycosidase
MRAAAPVPAAPRGRSMPFIGVAMTLNLLFSAVRLAAAPPTLANHTPDPASVTIAGSLQQELGCPGDWDPACAVTHLSHDANDDVWQGTWMVPAGSWEYKAALNDGWVENYGLHAERDGDNISLAPGIATATKFYYDHKSHWITDSLNSVIAVAPGDFQSELGCAGDWDPACLRSWLQDPDGDGIHVFVTTALPAGSYEAKVAINESWAENYGRDGVFDGLNIPFNVPAAGNEVTFSYVASSHILTISVAGVHAPDNNVEWVGLRHDSRSDVYRTPGGAVPAGTAVTLRLRTFHDDVTAVKARLYSLQQGGQQVVAMALAAGGIGCYEPGLEEERCDFWELTVPEQHGADNLWYRFIVTDGTDTDYYADDTPALDGGLGATTNDAVDQSWALMLHVPGFEAPDWAKHAVIYQIFPDRFRNGRAANDPTTGDVRYDDPVLKLPWGTLPEGYCRNYADGNVNCPWRFDDTPPPTSPTKEQPRGRDYMGGDLRGVDQKLDYLAALGVNTIYFNPIFDAGSNHSYDTQEYRKIDPYFGTLKDWNDLVAHAEALGIRIVLDGVFNHMSSDSPFFDRYHHYDLVGACESLDSPYRSWFVFTEVGQGNGKCVGSGGTTSAAYEGWFGFDSIPVLAKSNAELQKYFLTAPNSIARLWLKRGAAGWRMDVSGDPSFPAGYWETFRDLVKGTNADALTISETWQKDSTLLRMLRGDRLDTTMNYRIRDAVIGFLTPGPFDPKGFADSGNVISSSDFANRLAAIREDYPDAAYYSLMNLLDSHDTERLLWTLTPGVETTAEKELNAANLAAGKARLRVASLIQFTVPGAPTVYYGDEVGMTGDDDPDDRRTYPWTDTGGLPDTTLLAHYQGLTSARADNPALTEGDFRVLFVDDGDGTVAFGRKTGVQGAVVALNRSSDPQTLAVSVGGYLPDGLQLDVIGAANAPTGGSYEVSDGELTIGLPPMSGLVVASDDADLAPPAAPTDLSVTNESANQVSLAWDPVSGATGYDVYYSPLSGGGYLKANDAPVVGASFTVTGLENARRYFFVVRALDTLGNASLPSGEVEGIPHLVIGWANLQWPPSMTHIISTIDRSDTAYGQVWIDGANGTSQPGPTPSLRAQLGFGPAGSNPTAASWTWVEASFNVDAGNNDEFQATMLPEAVGTYHYVYRYTVTAGRDWLYADLDGPIAAGALPSNPGVLTVNSSGDSTPPAVPVGLQVESASPAGVELSWDPVVGDASLHGYEVGRSSSSGGPYTVLALVTGEEQFTDATVAEGATYYYVVRSIDTSFNRSAWSGQVSATAELRTVSVIFNVDIPAWSPAELDVYIAGTLSRFDGGYPDWDPNVVAMTEADPNTWTITFTGLEGTLIEYKYALYHADDWFHVEKDGSCGEIANRQLTLSYGAAGTQIINDAVANWRNVAPCGN